MRFLIALPTLLACLALAAHHSRGGEPGLIGLWMTLPLALLIRRRWADLAVHAVLLAGACEWILTVGHLVEVRKLVGLPYGRLQAILGGVATFTAAAGFLLHVPRWRRARPSGDVVGPGLTAFLIATGLMVIVQMRMEPAGLLAERFLPTAGWWELVGLGFYAGWLADRLRDPARIRTLRPRVWLVFSAIFFTQLLLGLAGVEKLLMTGKLHLPVPALIAAGPIYRGGGLFMAILFTASVLVAGPAWCSWLCYIGAWDDRLARGRRLPTALPAWRNRMRLVILAVVMVTAFVLGRSGVGGVTAAWLAGGFGLAGVGLMVLWSRRTGQMTHCTAFCPMGWVATRLGKLSPWRLRVAPSCTDCGACTPTCRYDALAPEDVLRRVPGEACTLCGDCVGRCPSSSLRYHAFGLDADGARVAFLTLVAALHAVWLGVARL